MGIYSSTQIRAAIHGGVFVCTPFQDAQLVPHGLQLHLGDYYYRAEADGPEVTHNPLHLSGAERYFEGPFRALSHEQQTALSGLRPVSDIPLEQPVMVLGPGERVVVHSHEFVGVPASHAVRAVELPVWHQAGVRVSANFLHLSRVARPSFVVTNTNAQKSVVLPVGAALAQLVFEAASETAGTQAGFTTTEIDTAISTWTPDAMLARTPPAILWPLPNIEGLRYV